MLKFCASLTLRSVVMRHAHLCACRFLMNACEKRAELGGTICPISPLMGQAVAEVMARV
ncbi:hypothetical protein [Nitrosomonas sp. Nm51]|uniref:hypothetical protein n=1 Tax=Nitrosomonas sp. Nm51 TaxID=133720 RepID=UPI0015A6C666|nr:hypothetical protein [Nitrosomonas sp. Nm51]